MSFWYHRSDNLCSRLDKKQPAEPRFDLMTSWTGVVKLCPWATPASYVGKFHIFFLFFLGTPLAIYNLESPDSLVKQVLGPDPAQGHVLQAVVPAGRFMAGELLEEEGLKDESKSFTLFSVIVSPGFDLQDDTSGDKDKLVKEFPKFKDFIEKFAR